jgi:flagellar basal-body rod modification protein FlgD
MSTSPIASAAAATSPAATSPAATSPAATNSAAASTGSKKTAAPTNPSDALGKDDFLKLMVAQLRSQDPMQPTDDSAYIGQLAQFTQLEQVTNLAQSSSQAASSQEEAQAVALIGHTVSYIDQTTGLTQQGPVQNVQIGTTGATLTVGGVAGVSAKDIKEVS